jgi:cyclin A
LEKILPSSPLPSPLFPIPSLPDPPLQDIYAYLRSTEAKYLPKASYMDKQPDITHNMRQILVDWLVEVSEEYKLQTETLYLAVNFIDRFLSLMSVQRAKLQLVGTAAMFIASKFEEIYPPDVTEFVYITDDTYTKRQVLRMEHLVMKVLEFDVSPPTSHLFCSKLSAMAGSDARTTSFAMYLNELTLMSASFLRYSPSLTAAASVALARHTVGLAAWPESVAESSGYRLEDIQACLLDLHQQHVAAEGFQQQAMREKYRQSKHHGVSDIAPALVARSL